MFYDPFFNTLCTNMKGNVNRIGRPVEMGAKSFQIDSDINNRELPVTNHFQARVARPKRRPDSRGCPVQAPLGRGFSLRPAQLGKFRGTPAPVLSTEIRFARHIVLPSDSDGNSTMASLQDGRRVPLS